mmetsp:Transcript_41102/g.91911  ORF Transcript_41102/g.91911 Transcript_41102/m.91911 type:complete len:126 (-) Transcript_41102:9-386(-)
MIRAQACLLVSRCMQNGSREKPGCITSRPGEQPFARNLGWQRYPFWVWKLQLQLLQAAWRLFLQAVSVTVFFAVTSGMVLGMAVHETVPGPPEPTRLEMAAAMIARCPFVSTFVSSLCGFFAPVL